MGTFLQQSAEITTMIIKLNK